MFFSICSKKVFLFLINIFITFQVDPIYYNINPINSYIIDKSLDSYKKFLLEIMHGKLPFKIEASSSMKYDIDFIEKVNGNIPYPYTLKSLVFDEENNGIFLGAGINLLKFKPEEMNYILSKTLLLPYEKTMIKSFCQKKGNEAKQLVNSTNYKIINIREFNEAVISFIIEKKIVNDFGPNQKYYNFLNTPFINGFLSTYIQLSKINNDIKNNLFNNYTSGSYIIQHLFEGAPFARFIQSKLISMMDNNIRYNNNHLLFVIPIIFKENEKQNIKDFINNYIRSLRNYNNYNSVKVSILIIYNENKEYIMNYNTNIFSILDDLLLKYKYNKTKLINISEIYEYSYNLFEKYKIKDIYENKIICLLLNLNISKLYSNQINDLINKYNKINIHTIPLINKPDSLQSFDIINYNIYYDFNKTINIESIKLAVSNMHINIDLTNKIENKISNKSIEGKIENLKLNDMDAPLYIEVNITKEKNESIYYEIELEIKKTKGYNIFVSDNNPYPNIKDYTTKFIKYHNNLKPKIRIKTYLINQFYIGIEGILLFNLTIRRKYTTNINKLNLTEGEYNTEPYNNSVYFKDETLKNLETFTSDYRPRSTLFKNDLPLDLILKYYSRGIDIDNTDDGEFFNYNLFIYLLGNSYLINTVYRNSENNNYYIGRYIELTKSTPLKLREDGLNQLLVNKIYVFINGNNKTLINTKPPNIYFDHDELKIIYNITNKKYINDLSYLLSKTSNTMTFKELTAEKKFILLCLYFPNSKENLDNIKSLAYKTPNYLNILQSLKTKNKNQDNLNKFIISFISNFEQQIKFEKNLIIIIMGKSFILSDIGINFIKEFYNTMSKTKVKISLLVYDTLLSKNEIKIIIPFYTKKISKLELLDNYKVKNIYDRYQYNNTDEQKMDFDKIIEYGLLYFNKYDIGIKKQIFIISDENLFTEDKYYINNQLININYNNHQKLRDKQIKLILISTKNAEKGNIPTLFSLKKMNKEIKPYTINENYFHVNNFENTSTFVNELRFMSKNSIINLNIGTRFMNDFYQGRLNYYEINFEDYLKDIIVIKGNLTNFNFYYSFDNPFPNPYIDLKADKIVDNDKITITDLKSSKLYLGIESKYEMKKQIIEIFSCETYISSKQYKNCKFVGSHRFSWYFLFLIIVIFIIGIIVHYFVHLNNKNQINIY